MKIPFFSQYLKKETSKPPLLDSLLSKKLKQIAITNDLYVYENITIYHHTYSFFIPLLILDTSRGIYIFEHKEWSYEELKDAKIQKTTNAQSDENTLAFEKAHDIIRKRFNELTHDDGVAIYNYLLMENLSADDYEHLDTPFLELLPKNKVIFNNNEDAEILEKLYNASDKVSDLPTAATIIGTLLVQYAIVDVNTELKLCSKDQIEFINADISEHITLNAPCATGKTSIILLKSILEKLKNPQLKVIILKPTLLSCEILKKQLLSTVEHAIIEIDITSIEIITPRELLNKQLLKLSKPQLTSHLYIDPQLMQKKANLADLIICDDVDFLPKDFIAYLKHIQNKSSLILVGAQDYARQYTLNLSYRLGKQTVYFHQTNPHAKALHLISTLLKTNNSKDILVISNNLSREKLIEDLESFIKDKAILLDSSKNLIDQDINNLLLSSYTDMHGINAKYIILMDICEADDAQLAYAIELCEDETYILYDNECEKIATLKEKYESC